jgi:hypothetical protein
MSYSMADEYDRRMRARRIEYQRCVSLAGVVPPARPRGRVGAQT